MSEEDIIIKIRRKFTCEIVKREEKKAHTPDGLLHYIKTVYKVYNEHLMFFFVSDINIGSQGGDVQFDLGDIVYYFMFDIENMDTELNVIKRSSFSRFLCKFQKSISKFEQNYSSKTSSKILNRIIQNERICEIIETNEIIITTREVDKKPILYIQFLNVFFNINDVIYLINTLQKEILKED